MDQNAPAETQPSTGLARLQATFTLPVSKKEIVLRELTGDEEMRAAADSGEGEKLDAKIRFVWARILRSLVSIDGERFDQSRHSPESLMNLFSAKDRVCLVEANQQIHGLPESQLDTFRSSIQYNAG